MNKLLAFCASIGILAIGTSVSFYLLIYIPERDAEKEKNIQACLDNASESYSVQKSFTAAGVEIGVFGGETANREYEKSDQVYKDAKDGCYKRYQ